MVLTIAGFDPGSGAGITADIKTIAAHGCYGVACITSLTVQSTVGVRRVEAASPKLVLDTLDELAADLPIAAVHVGMLGDGPVASAVADFLERSAPAIVVLDPVLQSSSGASLLDAQGVEVLTRRLLPLATVVTPNVDEAAALTGLPVTSLEQMKAAATGLHALGAGRVVITGGHLCPAVDLLSVAAGQGQPQQSSYAAEHLESTSTHGTGCAFSTALACRLACGHDLSQAVVLAKEYVRQAILHASPIGKGRGPVNHLFQGNVGEEKSQT